MTRLTLGKRGEQYARRRLERQGWSFITANWHCVNGELDLVMREGAVLVFVEVKTRRGDGAGRAEEGISANKVKRLLLSAEWFLSEHQELGEPLGESISLRLPSIGLTRSSASRILKTQS
jgi:putative endonuclease